MAKTSPTAYVVLRQDENEKDLFHKIGETEASSASQAIKQVVSSGAASPAEGNYVASPSRSWQLTPVKIEMVAPRLIIGGDTEPSPAKQLVPETPLPQRPEPITTVIS